MNDCMPTISQVMGPRRTPEAKNSTVIPPHQGRVGNAAEATEAARSRCCVVWKSTVPPFTCDVRKIPLQRPDQLEAWSVSGSSSALIPESTTRQISRLGYGLQFDGERFISVDCGYSTWSGATLYYREFGTGWMYETTPAPGTTTWYGEVVESGDEILSANVQTYWSAASIGDRVDYWISADNGTHWEEVESESTIHFDYPEPNWFGKPN